MVLRKLSKTFYVRHLTSPHLTFDGLIVQRTAGDYTLIVSAFEPHHTGPYTLKVECSTPFDLKSIPQEGAGMYSKIIKGAWDVKTAAGGPAFQKYALNPKFDLILPASGQVKYVFLI